MPLVVIMLIRDNNESMVNSVFQSYQGSSSSHQNEYVTRFCSAVHVKSQSEKLNLASMLVKQMKRFFYKAQNVPHVYPPFRSVSLSQITSKAKLSHPVVILYFIPYG